MHPLLCIPDMIAAQQRNGMCAGIGYKVLRLINEKYPDLNSAHVFVQGVLKGYDHWVPGTLVAAEQFVRAFELRLPNKAYVTQTIKTIVDTVIKTDTFRGDASPSNGRGRGAASPSKKGKGSAGKGLGGLASSSSSNACTNCQERMIEDIDRKGFLLSVCSMLPFPDQVQHILECVDKEHVRNTLGTH